MSLRANLAGIDVGDDFPVRVVGVLNASPESFYGGSVRRGRRQLQREAERMLAEGADLLDVGAMSTAPYGNGRVSAEEEEKRLHAAVAAVAEVTRTPISADTQRSTAAAAALRAGAAILNDVSGLAADPDMGRVARDAGGVILMACPQEAEKRDPVREIIRLLRRCLTRARGAGVAEERIVLDPGVGFFRDGIRPWYEIDCLILSELRRFRRAGRPLLVGASRKSFLGHIANRPDPRDRLYASVAAATAAVLQGAALIRTHDVAATVDAVRVASALRGESLHPASFRAAGAPWGGKRQPKSMGAERHPR